MGFITLAEWVRPLALRALDPVVQVLPDFFAPVLVFLGALGPVWQLALVVLLIASATVSAVSVVYFCVRCQRDAVRGDLDESEDEREQDELELEQELALERKDWRRRQQQQEEE